MRRVHGFAPRELLGKLRRRAFKDSRCVRVKTARERPLEELAEELKVPRGLQLRGKRAAQGVVERFACAATRARAGFLRVRHAALRTVPQKSRRLRAARRGCFHPAEDEFLRTDANAVSVVQLGRFPYRPSINLHTVPALEIAQYGAARIDHDPRVVSRDKRIVDRDVAIRTSTEERAPGGEVELLQEESKTVSRQAELLGNTVTEYSVGSSARRNTYLRLRKEEGDQTARRTPSNPCSMAAGRHANVKDSIKADVLEALTQFALPLVQADGGELYVVAVSPQDIHLHLAGSCAGCPGFSLTRDRLLEPTVRGVAPKLSVHVTTGWRVPDGATRLG
jgi:Fe-S cluster biogenesis protein NfuA